MNGIVLICLLVMELALCIFWGLRVFARCKSQKRTYFLAFIGLLFCYVLGYLLEVTSKTPDGAFAGIRVAYLGAALLPQAFLLFIMDLHDLKISKRLVFALAVIPLITIVLVWTSQYHQYYHTTLIFSLEEFLEQPTAAADTWHYVYHSFALLCLLAACLIVIRRLKFNRNMYRYSPLLLLAALLQIAPQLIYEAGLRTGNVFYPVLCLALAAAFAFIYLMRYNIFDIVSLTSDLALNFMTEAVLIFDRKQCFLNGNSAAGEFLAQFGDISKGRCLSATDSWPQELANLEYFKEKDGSVVFELASGGARRYFQADIKPILAINSQLAGWLLLIRDVMETKILTQRLAIVASTDTLTGIMNRDKFMELAQQEFDKNYSDKNNDLSVIIIGMDNYKKINDRYGDNIGDILLRLVSENLKNILGSEPLFARYSGTQFILLTDTGLEQALELAGRIKDEIACRAYEINGDVIKCTASIGIATKSLSGNSPDKVIRNSVEALRHAQTKGCNLIECYF